MRCGVGILLELAGRKPEGDGPSVSRLHHPGVSEYRLISDHHARANLNRGIAPSHVVDCSDRKWVWLKKKPFTCYEKSWPSISAYSELIDLEA
ncbi:MAG: hypothetical protein CME19_22020 [Gemmatimonadetes bacterium]|nr:hypothetical protein [Gemmatimonadota bacterium]